MKYKVIIVCLMLLLFTVSIQTQIQTPKPAPEMKNYEVFIGEWEYEGESKETPIGPAGKYTGTQTARFILNGFFMEWRWKEKGPYGEVEGFQVDWYDDAKKSYNYHWYQNDGTSGIGTVIVKENIWSVTSDIIHKGIEYHTRGTDIFAPDGMSFIWKKEISTDGKNWMPYFECNVKKVINR